MRQIEQNAPKHVVGLAKTRAQLWAKMCEHDGIEPTSRLVVFSENNPFTIFYDNVSREFKESLAAGVPGGGYVGLRMQQGRAVL